MLATPIASFVIDTKRLPLDNIQDPCSGHTFPGGCVNTLLAIRTLSDTRHTTRVPAGRENGDFVHRNFVSAASGTRELWRRFSLLLQITDDGEVPTGTYSPDKLLGQLADVVRLLAVVPAEIFDSVRRVFVFPFGLVLPVIRREDGDAGFVKKSFHHLCCFVIPDTFQAGNASVFLEHRLLIELADLLFTPDSLLQFLKELVSTVIQLLGTILDDDFASLHSILP